MDMNMDINMDKNFSSTLSFINNGPRFNGVFSTNKLSRITNGEYAINPDNKNKKETHWVSLFIDRNTAVCFDSFGTEHIPQEVLNKIRDK